MQHPEHQYLDLVKDIQKNGAKKPIFFTPEVLEEYKKKGEEAPYLLSVFGRQHRWDMKDGFPLLTTKKTFFKSILTELIWFLSGSSNIKYLVDNKNPIWNDWAWKAYHKHCLENEPEKDRSHKNTREELKNILEQIK